MVSFYDSFDGLIDILRTKHHQIKVKMSASLTHYRMLDQSFEIYDIFGTFCSSDLSDSNQRPKDY